MSSIKPIAIASATPAQLAAFARTFLNLDISEAASDAEILSAIDAAQPGVTTIFATVEDEADAPIERINPPLAAAALATGAEDTNARVAGSLGQEDPRAIISIMSTETEDGTGGDDVAVGVNGRVWQLKRGVDLNVPWRVVEALKAAVTTVVRHNDEGDVVTRDSQRIPFTILSQPSAEELAAWHAKTDAAFCP